MPGVPLSGVATADLTPVGGTLVRVQTPQAFRADLLLAAYERPTRTASPAPTPPPAWSATPAAVHCIPGDPRNVKVTYRPDLALAERLLRP